MGSKNLSDVLVVFQFHPKAETEYGITKGYLYLSFFNGGSLILQGNMLDGIMSAIFCFKVSLYSILMQDLTVFYMHSNKDATQQNHCFSPKDKCQVPYP